MIPGRIERGGGLRLNPFYAELHAFRWVDDDAFSDGLELARQRAVEESENARAQWPRGEHFGSVKNRLLS